MKFVSPGFDGMPDRILLMPEGKVVFVEVKAPGKRPRPLQMARHKLLRDLGFSVFILDDESQITKIIEEIGGDAKMKFIPHEYQQFAINYIESNLISAVFLDMGLG